MDELKLPSDTKLASKIVNGHVRNEQTKIDRGAVGDFLGSSNSVPANIAALIALSAAAVLIIAVVFWAGGEGFTYKEGVATLSSLITLALGYLFGRASKSPFGKSWMCVSA